HPLIGYGIRGAIWYQGERNSKTIPDGQLYASQLKTMITDWRERWGIGDFQFITVQLPNFKARQKEPIQNTGWVAVRESELKSLRLPNTGIAITTDVGEANDIHPKDKQTVGLRLALWALGTTYGQEIVHSGPLFSSLQLKAARKTAKGTLRPGTLTLYFEHVGDALKTSDGKKLRGFAIAGEDK
ncbi:MAG: sialate O-acetylesterase, partial [Planctomycetaceae bacterium]|nr:sialate O-acetylesterase [Planctomycetaceae bacterium]